MTAFHRSTLARAGVVALLAAGGLAAVAAPAQAADQADLALVPLSYNLAKGVKEAKSQAVQVLRRQHPEHGRRQGRQLHRGHQQA